MRRRLPALTALVALFGGATFLLVPPAAAQPYPPGPCTATVSTSGVIGSGEIGATITLTVRAECTFTAGGTATVVVDGQPAGTKPINADGSVTVTITILSATELSINPVVRGHCGANTVIVSAPSSAAGGTTVTHSAAFDVICPSGAATVRPAGAGGGAGAPTAAGAAGGGPGAAAAAAASSAGPPAATAAKPVKGGVAFTGGNILRWSAVALGLVGIGGLLVAFERRRKGSELTTG